MEPLTKTIPDQPGSKPEREWGLHIDAGRKYFSAPWFIELLQAMHDQGFNTLQLHFSEHEGFRLELPRFEFLCSDSFLSQTDLQDILTEAKRLEIQVIPSFDTPGHVRHLLHTFPEFRLEHELGALDITNPQARNLIKDLISSILKVFPNASAFHMGGDEFVDFDTIDSYASLVQYAQNQWGKEAQALDVYYEYLDEIASFILAQGVRPRLWNDGLYRLQQPTTYQLRADFDVTYWTSWHPNMAPLKTFVDKGYRVFNFMDEHLYFVLGEKAGYQYPTPEKLQDSFDPAFFPKRNASVTSKREQTLNIEDSHYGGCYLSVWCDDPEAMSEAEVLARLKPLMMVFNSKHR